MLDRSPIAVEANDERDVLPLVVVRPHPGLLDRERSHQLLADQLEPAHFFAVFGSVMSTPDWKYRQ